MHYRKVASNTLVITGMPIAETMLLVEQGVEINTFLQQNAPQVAYINGSCSWTMHN